jgi:hypothetical protein
LPGISNYFLGNDPKKWHTDVPNYARVEAKGVYRGIDLAYYGNQRKLEYDFIVAPGADPGQVQLAWEGADSLRVNQEGDLVIATRLGDMVQKKPQVYQEVGGKQVEVATRYQVLPDQRVKFELARYDRKRELRIDPVVLLYSTYLGGSGEDQSRGIAVDTAGSAYVTGFTRSSDFPTQSAYQGTRTGEYDVFVTKLSPAGDALVYSTYLGGSDDESGIGIAVDGAGSAYITGSTESTDFPTQSPYQATLQGSSDVFVTKLGPSGNALAYSTYLGGGSLESGVAIAVDGAGAAYVTGHTESTNFPTQSPCQATRQGGGDAFVTKLTPAGSALAYSTYLGGGSIDEAGSGIAVDGAGSAYVTGYTSSTNFPTHSAYQATKQGGRDAFVTKLTPSGNALAYSTYLGGSGDDWGGGIAVDGAGSAYVTGTTGSTNFPTQSPFQATLQGGYYDVFVTKLTPAGNALAYSTYLGGSGYDGAVGIAVDAAGSAYVAGNTNSADFPTQSPYQATNQGGMYDAFVTKLSPAGNAPAYSTYLGGTDEEMSYGIAVDGAGAAYITGLTWSADFPTQSPFQGALQGVDDVFVTKLRLALPPMPRKIGTYNSGLWGLDLNGNGSLDSGDQSFFLGFAGAIPLIGDWNGDGRTKAGVYSNGFWFLDYDGNGFWDGGVADKLIGWGWPGATPFVGDWNGDGKTEIGVYSGGFWFLDYDGDFLWNPSTTDKQVGWGWAGVTPVVGDWNGDGKTKIGVYVNGFWFLDYDGNYSWDGGVVDKQVGWGWSGVTPIVGDWNGDGKTKIGVYAGGYWYLDYDGNYLWEYPAKDKIWEMGWTGTTPMIGDWSGDGKDKAGAFFNGYWYLDYNGNGAWDGSGTDRVYGYGQAGDTPVVGKW